MASLDTDDAVGTTPVRNPLNIESLSSWIVNHSSSPVLESLIFGSEGRTNQDACWLQERIEIKQFGENTQLARLFINLSS